MVSVSLGSPRRDWEGTVRVAGERLRVRRVGTGGDLARAAALLRELDGRVAAIGLGGINTHLVLGHRRYDLPQGARLAGLARRTPVVDGAGWKAAVEPAAVSEAAVALNTGGVALAGRTALVTSVLDRPALARALAAAGCRVLAGDAYYALRLPLLLPLERFAPLAAAALPLLRRLPIHWLYPLGRRQERVGRCGGRLYRRMAVLAGDFNFLRSRLPERLEGQVVIASTATEEDAACLAARGAGWLITPTPPVGGRRLAANAWEALAVALAGKRPEDMAAADHLAVWRVVGGGPWIERLN